jgi:hypothetical protein
MESNKENFQKELEENLAEIDLVNKILRKNVNKLSEYSDGFEYMALLINRQKKIIARIAGSMAI